jgi:hypothetical protein
MRKQYIGEYFTNNTTFMDPFVSILEYIDDELNKKVIINCMFFTLDQLHNIELPPMNYISSFTEADLDNHINLFMESIKLKN